MTYEYSYRIYRTWEGNQILDPPLLVHDRGTADTFGAQAVWDTEAEAKEHGQRYSINVYGGSTHRVVVTRRPKPEPFTEMVLDNQIK